MLEKQKKENKLEIVIVDSDPMVSHINAEYVRRDKRFCVAKIFQDGKEVLEFLKKKPVSLLLLELALPGYDGLELMRDMLKEGIDTDVIVITALRDGEALAEALRLGAMDYLVKPYTYNRLKKALDKYADYTLAVGGIETAGQETVDYLLSIAGGAAVEESETERKMMQCFRNERAGKGLTAKEFADKLSMSIVTARRYLKKMVDAGRLMGEIDYNTGGHPRVIYHLSTGMNKEN